MTLKRVAGKAELSKPRSALNRFDYYVYCENPISNCQVFYLYFSDQTSKTIGKMASSCSKYKHLLDRTLRKFFYLLGYRIGQTPTYFIIVPIIFSILFQRRCREAKRKGKLSKHKWFDRSETALPECCYSPPFCIVFLVKKYPQYRNRKWHPLLQDVAKRRKWAWAHRAHLL